MSKNILILIHIITCVKIDKIVVRLSYHFPDFEIVLMIFFQKFSEIMWDRVLWIIIIIITYFMIAFRKQNLYFVRVNVLKYHILRLTYLAINITITMSARRNTRPPPIPTPKTRLAGIETRVPFSSTQVKSWTMSILFKWY